MSKFSVYALETTASGDYDLLIYDPSEGLAANQVKRIGIDTVLAGELAAAFGNIIIPEGGTSTTPASNKVRLYSKTDGLLYSKDDAGNEDAVSGGRAQSYTPTLTNGTLGDGTISGTYNKVGKLVLVNILFTLGSTSAIGTAPTFSLPATPSLLGLFPIGVVRLNDATGSAYSAVAQTTADGARPLSQTVSGSNIVFSNVTATAPFTWTTSDVIQMTLMYIAS